MVSFLVLSKFDDFGQILERNYSKGFWSTFSFLAGFWYLQPKQFRTIYYHTNVEIIKKPKRDKS